MANPLGSFINMNSQAMGSILNWMSFPDIYHLSLTSKKILQLVNSALKQVPYIPPEARSGKGKKAVEGFISTADELSSWVRTPHDLFLLGRKLRIISNLMSHGEQLDALATNRADWVLLDACLNRLIFRIQELAKQSLVARGFGEVRELNPDLKSYRTPKGWTYLMILASACRWNLLRQHIRPDSPLLFDICDDGETLLSVLLLRSMKNNDVELNNLITDVVKWGGGINRAGDDRALALAAYLGKWDIIDSLLKRGADPCTVTLLSEGQKICPLTSFLQHDRTNSLESEMATDALSRLPELGVKCFMNREHPFISHLIDEEPEHFLTTLTQCDQTKTYFHPFSYHMEYPIQMLPESYMDDFPAAVKELVNVGANINDCSEGEESVPFLSRWIKLADEEEDQENKDILKRLMDDFHPDLQVRDGKGSTPIHYACDKNSPEILKVLLESMNEHERAMALFFTIDCNGMSPVMLVAGKKGQPIYNYVCSVTNMKSLNAYDISWFLLEQGLNPMVHLRTICSLYSNNHDTLFKCLERTRSKLLSFESDEAALIIAEFCPSFAMEPMQKFLGIDTWQNWFLKTWCSQDVATTWVSYYVMHPEESTSWRRMLSMLNGPLSLDKEDLAKLLVIGAAHDPEVGRLLKAWVEKFGRIESNEKPLITLYLEEGGSDREIVNLLRKLLTRHQLECIFVELWNSRCYIDSDIYRFFLGILEISGENYDRSFRRTLALWKLTNEDKDKAKALIEKEDP